MSAHLRPLALSLLLLSAPALGQATLEERVTALEAKAEGLQPLAWLAGLLLAGGVGTLALVPLWAKRVAERTAAEAVGLKIRELHQLVEERDLGTWVRERCVIVIVGPDGDDGLKRLLLRDGWKKVSTASALDGSEEAVERALRETAEANLVVFDRLPEERLVYLCQRRGVRELRYAGFTREYYKNLPTDVRDAVLLANSPDQLLLWVESAAVRLERARRRVDRSAPVAG